jgi:ubiquinone/menaquinone biosynthesis C-methylase UbiE
MNWTIVILIVAAAGLLVWRGSRRVVMPRAASFEGIEDPQVAQAYNRISQWPQFRLLRRLVVGKLAGHHPSGTLADIGCGPGYLVTLIAEKHPDLRVLGLDTSDEMIKSAESNASRLGLSERVEFRLGDVGDLPLPDGMLDFAVSTLSLHHWTNPSSGLAEIHRVLNPGGQFLLFDLRRDSCGFFLWLIRFAQAVVVPGAIRRANEPLGSLQSSYTLAEVESLFASSPFREYKVEGGVGWIFVWGRKAS